MFRVLRPLALAFACACTASLAHAEATEPDLSMRIGFDHVSYVLNADATSVETHEWSRTVLKQTAIEWAKQASVSYSTSVQKAEILEAYTKKADGRRIDVPKDNYQLNINKGRDRDQPLFSDYSSISVIFPDVAVGDSVVLSYRITQTEAIFPGHFSVSDEFSREAPYDDVKISIDYPESLWVQYEGRGLNEKISSPASGRKLIEWSYANPKPVKSDRHDYSVYDPDKETGYAFSTFHDYAEIASAYAQRALPKAEVTDQIRTLATQIVGERSDPRAQANALYDWVATKITYGGNCVGVGAVVPHDLSFIVDNRMGDCKDHATLLQALLAARGIESQQVLINAGSIFRLPKIPVVSNINHVINYIPRFDLYVDSTSADTPFGWLPGNDRGKPVLHVGHFKADAHTPVPAQARTQKIVSRLKIADDGAISGTIDVSLTGDTAAGMRAWARQQDKNDEENFVQKAFRARGVTASGKLVKDDPTALLDTYHYKVLLTRMEKYVRLGSSGAFYIAPILAGSGVGGMVTNGTEEKVNYDTACTNGSVQEDYEIELPRRMKVLSIPEKMKVASSVQAYEASYTMKAGKLLVHRAFRDHTPAAVCPPKISDEYISLGEKVSDNLKEQVLYK